MNNIQIEIYKGRDIFREISGQFDSLAISSWFHVYTTSGWFQAWLDTYGDNIELCTIVARVNDEFAGFLPLCRRRTNRHGLFLKISEPLTGGQADYHCPVIKEGLEEAVLPKLLDAAWDILGRSGAFQWEHIADVNPAILIMRDSIQNHGLQSVEFGGICPRLAIKGNYQFIENQWKKSHRTDVRRQRRRLAEKGEVTLWIPQNIVEAESFLSEFFEVYTRKWLSQNYPSRFNIASTRKYFHNMVKNLWGKGLHISTLKLDGCSISYHFGFFSKGWLLWYMPTYRIEYEKFSPTKLHISYLVEKGVEEGWQGIDFLQGDESYKFDWANESIKTTTFVVGFSKYHPSYFWFSKGKDLVRQKIFKWYMRLLACKQKVFKRSPEGKL